MQFPIVIKHETKTIRLQVEKIEETETTEKFRVIAKNQSFLLQNNRPVIIAAVKVFSDQMESCCGWLSSSIHLRFIY
jgi:hypothetical protein